MYVGSVMRFILFDSIIAKECHIRWGWSRRLGPGWRYFVWKFGYILLTLAGIVVLVGFPLALAFAKGWLREPKAHLPALVLGGIILFLVFFIFFLATALILVLTKDFVVPQMALENVDVMEGWRRLWPMMKAEKGAYAAYIGMKIVLAVVAAILIAMATLILGLIIVIPSIGVGILAVLTGKAAGLTWNAHTIALAVVVGCHFAGNFSLSGFPDLCACHCVLSRVFHLFLCRALPSAERCALSRAASVLGSSGCSTHRFSARPSAGSYCAREAGPLAMSPKRHACI